MTKQEQYDKTHLKIFKQAYQLFQEKSYEQVTIRDICRKCDLSIGAFYHHYSSKEAIISEGYKQFDQMLEEILKNKTFSSSKEEILYLLELEISTTEKEGWQFTLTYFKNQMDAKEKYILDENRYFYQRLLRTCKTYSPNHYKKLIEQLLRSTRGTIYDWCLHNGSYSATEYGLDTVKMILEYYENHNMIKTID